MAQTPPAPLVAKTAATLRVTHFNPLVSLLVRSDVAKKYPFLINRLAVCGGCRAYHWLPLTFEFALLRNQTHLAALAWLAGRVPAWGDGNAFG